MKDSTITITEKKNIVSTILFIISTFFSGMFTKNNNVKQDKSTSTKSDYFWTNIKNFTLVKLENCQKELLGKKCEVYQLEYNVDSEHWSVFFMFNGETYLIILDNKTISLNEKYLLKSKEFELLSVNSGKAAIVVNYATKKLTRTSMPVCFRYEDGGIAGVKFEVEIL